MGASTSRVPNPLYGLNGSWTPEIYFYLQSDEPFEPIRILNPLGLLDHIDKAEKIENIWIYSHKLYGQQVTEILLFHAFIVFETKDWYWSIEKNNQRITIQRSKSLHDVKDFFEGTERLTPISERNHDCGKMRIVDLINWLDRENEISKTYYWAQQELNCQGFAKRIFDQFAKTKKSGLPVVNF